MKDITFEREILKNYFIKNSGFAKLSENQPKLYSYLSQLKYNNRLDTIGINYDYDAPGGVTTLMFNVMGYMPNYSGIKIEPYAMFLCELYVNGADMTGRELNDLEKFRDYYGYKNLEEFIEEVKPVKYLKYNYNDVLVTELVSNLILHSGRNQTFTRQFKEIVSRYGEEGNNYLNILLANLEELTDFVKKILPPIEEGCGSVVVTDSVIMLNSNTKILWSDLIITLVLGLGYRGLYRPGLQVGVYLNYKINNNIMFLNTNFIIKDEVNRRMLGVSSLLGFWGVEDLDNFPTMSYEDGYVIYPVIDIGPITGRKGLTDVFIIWKDGYFMFTDRWTLPSIYKNIPQLHFTSDYYSTRINVNHPVPCLYDDNGVSVPLIEKMFSTTPDNGDYRNLTAYNVGISG